MNKKKKALNNSKTLISTLKFSTTETIKFFKLKTQNLKIQLRAKIYE